MKICLNAGHWLKDSGAIYKDIYERDYTMAIRDKVFLKLKNIKADVIAVPDVLDLTGSIKFVNDNYPGNFALDIHLNYLSDTKVRGCEVYCNPTDGTLEMAMKLSEVFSKESGIPNRGFMNEMNSADQWLAWLHKVKGKPILFELLFITNNEDRSVLLNEGGIEKLGDALFKAICSVCDIKLEVQQTKQLEETVGILTKILNIIKKLLNIK